MTRAPLFTFFGLIALIFCLGLALDDRSEITRPKVSPSIKNGLAFIATAHTPYHFADPYLEYVYPGEKIECGLPGCQASYRTLDAYFALTMIKPRLTSSETNSISEVLSESDIVLSDMVPRWRIMPINNTLVSATKEADGIALDTYCILGTLTNDAVMANQVLKYLSPGGNWIADDYYQEDRWRNIADESWCLRLLIKTGVASEKIPNLVQNKVDETAKFLESAESVSGKLAVLYHMLFLINDLPDAPNADLIKEYQNQSVELARTGAIDADALALGNLLESLVRTKYTNSNILRTAVRKLINLQGTNGSWLSQGDYPVFTTLRSLAGLTAYREANQ